MVSPMRAELRLKGPTLLACSDTERWKCKQSAPDYATEPSNLKDLDHVDASQPVGEPVFVRDMG